MSQFPPELPAEACATRVAGTAIHALLDETRRVLLAVQGSVGDDPEPVHQLRVTTRRADAGLRLFDFALAPDEARRWRKRLKRLRKSAGEARDLDVLLERFSSQSSLDQALHRKLEHRRNAVQAPLLRLQARWSDNEKWHRQQLALADSLAKAPPSNCQPQDQGLPTTWRGLAQQHLDRQTERLFDQARGHTRSLKRLHAFRIQAKHFRYFLEWTAGLGDRAVLDHLLQTLKTIQDALGAVQDHETARHLLKSAGRDKKLHAAATTWGRREKREAAKLIQHWRRDWKDHGRRALRRGIQAWREQLESSPSPGSD